MSGAERSKLSRIWLFVIAISLHNFPEGLAVGVSFGSPDDTAGYATAFGIGLQNVPEGLAVALSLAAVGYGRLFSFLIAVADRADRAGRRFSRHFGDLGVKRTAAVGAGVRRRGDDLGGVERDHPGNAPRPSGRHRDLCADGRACGDDEPRLDLRLTERSDLFRYLPCRCSASILSLRDRAGAIALVVLVHVGVLAGLLTLGPSSAVREALQEPLEIFDVTAARAAAATPAAASDCREPRRAEGRGCRGAACREGRSGADRAG